jgi:hypothetical protein
MSRFPRPTALAWLSLVVIASAFIWGAAWRRAGQAEQLSNSTAAAPLDAKSPSGYARGNRNLVLPDYAVSPQPWIMDVQKLVATGTWRIRQVDYDNAPEGRAAHGSSLQRWWLRLIAGFTDGNRGQSVERAALFANAALQVLLCAGLGCLAAWQFGAAAGGLLAAAIALLFPFAAGYAPGRLDDHALFLALNLTGWILLLSGMRPDRRAPGIWFIAAGAAAGLGMWIDAGTQLVVCGAIGAGVGATRWRPAAAAGTPAMPLPWRLWAAAGGLVAIAGWLVEGRPGGIAGLSLGSNHPWLVLAWLAFAEFLRRIESCRPPLARAGLLTLAAAALACLGPMAWLLYRGGTSSAFGPTASLLAEYTAGGGIAGWLKGEGSGFPLVASLLPIAVGGIALWSWQRDSARRPLLAFGLAASVLLLVLGLWQLRWWGLLDIALLGLLVVIVAGLPESFAGLGVRVALALVLLPGLALVWPRSRHGEEMSPTEARALVERDLAQWLAVRSEPGAIAFAPPALSASLSYYGGLRVIASPFAGNRDGLALAGRISGITSMDEAQALVQRRGIQYIILPSWDPVLDELAKIGSPTPERSLIALLRQWLPPRWLRPVPYQLPVIGGLEQDSVAVFEVVEPQENAIALSRLAEYFAETGRLQLAAAVGDSLERGFATDAGALIARARVALARGEGRVLSRVLPALLPAVADGKDEDLPWERRVSLAIVLAHAKRPDLVRTQLKFCLAEADRERLRALGPVTLYQFLTLAAANHVEFTDPALHQFALGLLPEEFRAQLRP